MAGIIGDTVSNIISWITTTPNDPLGELEEEMNRNNYSFEEEVGSAVRKPEPVITTKPVAKQREGVATFRGRGPELMVIEPHSFAEDATQMISYLQEGKTIVLNFQLLDKTDAQRLVDFVSGATGAMNGHQQKISDTVFIFAPTHTTISADSLRAKSTITDSIWDQRQY